MATTMMNGSDIMKKLTELEYMVMRHFDIKPTNIQMANGEEWMPSLEEVASFCMHNNFHHIVYNKLSAYSFLVDLANKLCDIEDGISLEDLAIWVLSNYLTPEELEKMDEKAVETFLKDWKYFCGFRKCDGNGMYYKWDTFAYWNGEKVLDPDSEDIYYKWVGDEDGDFSN